MIAAALAVRFMLELGALAAFATWGFETADGTAAKIALGIGLPLVAAIAWGMFVAPKAPIAAPFWARLGVELLVFGGAAAALAASGRPTIAIAFALLAVVEGALLRVLGEA